MSTRYIYLAPKFRGTTFAQCVGLNTTDKLEEVRYFLSNRSENQEKRGCFEAIQPPAQWPKVPNFVQKLPCLIFPLRLETDAAHGYFLIC